MPNPPSLRPLATICALVPTALAHAAPAAAQIVKPAAPLPVPAQRALQEQLEQQREADRAAEKERLRQRNEARLNQMIEYRVDCRLSLLRVMQRNVFISCSEVREGERYPFDQRTGTGAVQRLSFYLERTAANEATAQMVTSVAGAALAASRKVTIFSQPIQERDVDAESLRVTGFGAALPIAAIQLVDR